MSAARGPWPLRDRPSLVWLVLVSALVLVHPFVPGSRWLMVHLVALGAVTHSIMVWSAHFTQALLRTDRPTREDQNQRLVALIAGTTLVLVGVPTTIWPLTVAGATLVVGAVGWHGWVLWRLLRTALPSRFGATVRYYIAAAAFLALGATLGAILGTGLDDPTHGRVLVAHTMSNVLGWVGLTVAGTLQTLWPTMLRTRMDDGATRALRRSLPWLAAAALVVITGALLGHQIVSAAGLLAYAAGWLGMCVPLARTARRKPPHSVATWSAAAAVVWLVVGLLALAVLLLLRQGTWAGVADRYGLVTASLVVGFALQLVLGVLTYLLPSVLGGGPSVVRAGAAELERWGFGRVVLVNAGLAMSLLPVPSVLRVVLTTVVFAALAASIPLMLRGIRASIAAKRALAEAGPPMASLAERRAAAARLEAAAPPRALPLGQLAGAAVVLALASSLGIALGVPAGTGGGTTQAAAAPVAATGETTRVTVEAKDMAFTPRDISVPAGNRLVITLRNTDAAQVHDLVLDNGTGTKRLLPGATAELDAGVIGSTVEGWCSIVGHRQMGMTLTITPTGLEAQAPSGSATSPAAPQSKSVDLSAPAAAGFTARDPRLPTVPAARVHKKTLTVTEVKAAVAPGVSRTRWTFNGQSMGPVLHGKVGDRLEITLVNDGTMGHSIDFHAGSLAPDRPMRTIPPGESLTYTFTATRAGIWMYHCSTMPMSSHISAGMFGAVIIEPDGLLEVDRSYVVVQSELYLPADPEGAVDPDKIAAGSPDGVVFNGVANQYDIAPLTAKVGERVRFWVLDAGPNRPLSFHIVGGQFDTVWSEGAYQILRGKDAFGQPGGGSQALGLQPAQGGFVELTFPEAGRYPLVNHVMADAERGAHGIVQVSR
ncbi:MAG: multicopper oxidase domain-containing protein [Micrococcales bacterium]|nr:multicopper oxidase domain-containing protein [Micrococcales bacterium]